MDISSGNCGIKVQFLPRGPMVVWRPFLLILLFSITVLSGRDFRIPDPGEPLVGDHLLTGESREQIRLVVPRLRGLLGWKKGTA